MDLVNRYLRAVKKDNVLTPSELNVLVKKAQAGNIEARNEIVLRNVGLVYKLSWKHRWVDQYIPQEDRVQQGMFGLMRAIKTFNTESGNAFSTYAIPWINQFIRRYIDDNKYIIRHPVHLTDMKRKYDKLVCEHPEETEEFYARLIAKEKGISYERVLVSVRTKQEMLSIDYEDEDGMVFQIGALDERILSFNVEKLLSYLSYREKFILVRRANNVTLKRLAEDLAISRERVRQIEKMALLKIKSLINESERLYK